MTLPYSGSISMGQINVELGRGSTTAISLDAAENGSYGAINTNSASRPSGSNPASMSEWYGYNHNAAAPAVYIYWNYNTGVCAGDYFQLFKDSTLMVNISVPQSNYFTATPGQTITVYVASGVKGMMCDNPSFTVYEDSNYFISMGAPGYNAVVSDSFTVGNVSEYEVNGYLGMVAPE